MNIHLFPRELEESGKAQNVMLSRLGSVTHVRRVGSPAVTCDFRKSTGRRVWESSRRALPSLPWGLSRQTSVAVLLSAALSSEPITCCISPGKPEQVPEPPSARPRG
jgi:hypothetical protein